MAYFGLGTIGLRLDSASRSLRLTWLRCIVLPLDLRAVFPAWIGLVIGLVNDASLIAVVGDICCVPARSSSLEHRSQCWY